MKTAAILSQSMEITKRDILHNEVESRDGRRREGSMTDHCESLLHVAGREAGFCPRGLEIAFDQVEQNLYTYTCVENLDHVRYAQARLLACSDKPLDEMF